MTDVQAALDAADSVLGRSPLNNHASLSWSSSLPDLFARLDHLTHSLVNALIDHSELLIAEKYARAHALEQSDESTASARDQWAAIQTVSHAAETIRVSNTIRGLEAEIAHLKFVIEHRVTLSDDLTPSD